MANETYNAGIDYFGLVTATTNALEVISSAENRSKQSSSGANSYGDITVVDSFGDTAAPSAEYEVIAALASASFPVLGTCATVASLANPVVLGTVTINTASGVEPKVSASGSMVQSGAATLREYTLPTFSLTARHRAQDFLAAVDIKIGDSTASGVTDYGLESVSATFPIEITLAQPKGVVANYDLHGGTATASYTMNWYASTAPTIVLTAAAAAAGYTISSPVTKACPENGYTQYTWTVSLPMTGEEASV
jgi:hypothetical protein